MKKKIVQYDWLDLIRGLAALAVFIGHLRIICFKDTEISNLNLLGKGTFFLTGFGHISVILFFVLSGFLIIKSIHESVLADKWSTSSYAENRLSRLWVVLIPSLILGLLLDKLGLFYFPKSLFYSGEWKYFFHQDLSSKLSFEIFIGNVFFTQKILVPTLGSNGALWSLANEFWYYIIFPLFYFAVFRHFNKTLRAFLGLLGIGLLFFVGFQIAINFPIWLMGGFAYLIIKYIDESHLKRTSFFLGFLLLFLLTIVAIRFKAYPLVFNYYTAAFTFALVIPFLINIEMNNKYLIAFSTFFSNISYTLYLAHLPFIYFVTSFINFQDKEWSTKNFFIYLMITILTLTYSFILWYLFERNTKKIKSFLHSLKLKNITH